MGYSIDIVEKSKVSTRFPRHCQAIFFRVQDPLPPRVSQILQDSKRFAVGSHRNKKRSKKGATIFGEDAADTVDLARQHDFERGRRFTFLRKPRIPCHLETKNGTR